MGHPAHCPLGRLGLAFSGQWPQQRGPRNRRRRPGCLRRRLVHRRRGRSPCRLSRRLEWLCLGGRRSLFDVERPGPRLVVGGAGPIRGWQLYRRGWKPACGPHCPLGWGDLASARYRPERHGPSHCRRREKPVRGRRLYGRDGEPTGRPHRSLGWSLFSAARYWPEQLGRGRHGGWPRHLCRRRLCQCGRQIGCGLRCPVGDGLPVPIPAAGGTGPLNSPRMAVQVVEK